MDNFLQELQRRKVLRTVLLYAMAVWLVLQIADVISEPLLLPQWVQRALIFAAILGFPIVAGLSWVFDLTRSGLIRTPDPTHGPQRNVGFVSIFSIAASVLIVSTYLAWQFEYSEPESSQQQSLHTLAVSAIGLAPGVTEPHLIRLTDELADRLEAVPQIRLASEDAIAILNESSSLQEQSDRLGVRYILGGTIEAAGNGVDVLVWLFDGNENAEVLRSEFQNAQLYVVNDLIVDNILKFLGSSPSGSSQQTTNAEAYNSYLQGLQQWVIEPDGGYAAELFSSAIDADPRFPLPHAGLCRYYVTQYEQTSSIESFETAERFCFRALSLDSGSIEVHHSIGQIYTATGNWERARDSFNETLNLAPEHFEAKLGLARTYLREDPPRVERMLTSLMQDHPGSPKVYNALQNYYFQFGRYMDAVAPARVSLRLMPDSEVAKINLTTNLLLAGLFGEAKELLLKLLEEDPQRLGDIHNNLATVYFFEGEYEEAEQLYRQAQDREPDNPMFARNTADTVWQQAGQDGARPLFIDVIQLGEEQLRINPDDLEVLSCVIVAFGSLGNEPEVIRRVDAILAIEDEDPQIHYDIAVGFSRLGDAEKMETHIQLALQFGYPDALLRADPDLNYLVEGSRI